MARYRTQSWPTDYIQVSEKPFRSVDSFQYTPK